jgi:hypothetical protein
VDHRQHRGDDHHGDVVQEVVMFTLQEVIELIEQTRSKFKAGAPAIWNAACDEIERRARKTNDGRSGLDKTKLG